MRPRTLLAPVALAIVTSVAIAMAMSEDDETLPGSDSGWTPYAPPINPSSSKASRSSRFRYIGTSSRGAISSDGNRFAAYIDSANKTRVLDHRGRLLRSFPTPPDVGRRQRTFIAGVGGGYLVWQAVRSNVVLAGGHTPVAAANSIVLTIADLKSGKIEQIDASPWIRRFGEDLVGVNEVGSNWLSAYANSPNGSLITYLNWRSGELATNTRDDPANKANVTPDLDDPGLWRRLCDPLRRPPDRSAENEGFVSFLEYQYQLPYGLPLREGYLGLQLQRCGAREPRVLDRCRSYCSSQQLGPAFVAWVKGRYAYVHWLRSRCERRVRIPGIPTKPLTVSRDRLFTSAWQGPRTSSYKLYSAPIPRC